MQVTNRSRQGPPSQAPQPVTVALRDMDGVIKDEVMNVDEVATFLRLDRKTVYAAVATRRIPHQRLGRRILFSRSALLQWLTGRMGDISTTTVARRERPHAEPQVRPIQVANTSTTNNRIMPVAGRRNSAQIEALKTRVLQAVKDEPLKGAQYYAAVFGTSSYMIGQILGRLVADGLLSRTGHARAAIYRPL